LSCICPTAPPGLQTSEPWTAWFGGLAWLTWWEKEISSGLAIYVLRSSDVPWDQLTKWPSVSVYIQPQNTRPCTIIYEGSSEVAKAELFRCRLRLIGFRTSAQRFAPERLSARAESSRSRNPFSRDSCGPICTSCLHFWYESICIFRTEDPVKSIETIAHWVRLQGSALVSYRLRAAHGWQGTQVL
jgi:hypothetical protein